MEFSEKIMIKLESNLTWDSTPTAVYFWDSNGSCSEVVLNKSLEALPSLLNKLAEGDSIENIIQAFSTKFQDVRAVLNFLAQNNLIYEKETAIYNIYCLSSSCMSQ